MPISRWSLRAKVSALIVASMLTVLTLSTSLGYIRQRQRALENMSLLASQTGQVIERSLQRDMLVSDFGRIQDSFDAIGEDERIRALYLMDATGRVVFAPRAESAGVVLSKTDPSCQPCHNLPAEQRPSGVVVTTADGQTVFRSMHPIENRPPCTECHDPRQRLIGLLLTDLSIAPVEEALSGELLSNLAWWSGTVVIVAVLANWAINRWVLTRLGSITTALEGLGDQGFTGELPETPADEIGRVGAAFNAMAGQIQKREQENLRLSEDLRVRAEERGELLERLIAAQEEERIRIARELHDELGQELTGSALSIEVALRRMRTDQPDVVQLLDEAHLQIGRASERMYELIMGLRPSVLDDLGLHAAVRAQAERTLGPAGMDFQIEGQPAETRLPAAVETALFRIIQEALTNAARHSRATLVTIRMLYADDRVEAQISDDGVGFDPEIPLRAGSQEGGFGLLGMQERANIMGGDFKVDSNPDGGARVSVTIPLDGMNYG